MVTSSTYLESRASRAITARGEEVSRAVSNTRALPTVVTPPSFVGWKKDFPSVFKVGSMENLKKNLVVVVPLYHVLIFKPIGIHRMQITVCALFKNGCPSV